MKRQRQRPQRLQHRQPRQRQHLQRQRPQHRHQQHQPQQHRRLQHQHQQLRQHQQRQHLQRQRPQHRHQQQQHRQLQQHQRHPQHRQLPRLLCPHCVSLLCCCCYCFSKKTSNIILLGSTWIWNDTGITVAGNGISGSALNQLNEPWNIFIDPTTDILYIADSLNHRIVKWLPGATSGVVIAGTGSSGSSSSQLNTPKDVYVDSFGNIYVADTLNQRIQFFPNGNVMGSTVSTGWGVGDLCGVYVYNQSIYACDFTKNAIWVNGTIAAGNQGAGSNSNQLNEPQGFTVDTLYNKSVMYIANSYQHTIVQWWPGASNGTIVAGTNGVHSNSSTTLNLPIAVKTDLFANLFIADSNNHRIQLYCRYPSVISSGRTIAGTTGSSGNSSTLLNYPSGLALDSSMNLYVSDKNNHRIQKFMRLF
ncbi:unnamed protein product [Rotaria sp. Silwood1]|nr:unnamed protein product [Rotaria sp. Silwood1]CAF3914509.1 unnamed protein product [Rotaria sp. Silwood1]CAF4853435.1 unnamed protein product [Rotaria sp. Silwood1]